MRKDVKAPLVAKRLDGLECGRRGVGFLISGLGLLTLFPRPKAVVSKHQFPREMEEVMFGDGR
jgi:hypothetical protein